MRFVLVAIVMAACSTAPAQRPRSEKPEAAVAVRLEARAIAQGEYEVTLTATPTAELPALTLTLDGQRQMMGPAHRGVPRTMTATVKSPAAGRDVVGVAALGGRSKAAIVHIGAVQRAAAAPPIHRVDVPGIGGVAEVRP
jgi:hypothetical protein